jgi:hypothetical protein
VKISASAHHAEPVGLSSRTGLGADFRDLLDPSFSDVLTRNFEGIRSVLHAEYPHAISAVDKLLEVLRRDPRLPILLGASGTGRRRLVKRLCDLTETSFCQIDPRGSTFNQVAMAWRKCHSSHMGQSGKAIRVLLINELDNALECKWPGPACHEPAQFFSRKLLGSQSQKTGSPTVTYIATAKNISKKFEIFQRHLFPIRFPLPTIEYLPILAKLVMSDLALQNEVARIDAPLTVVELEKIGLLWQKENCSLRALGRLVGKALKDRDDGATRH